ncbi:hypothetical protein MDAP_000323 [Mitosporidium daphniae]|uniref:Uncharacterized protein n=1 Tax=Mitosporidium daphniae TaxID=1485682 RepID=A0A098VU59_9MICR|nr:uncharacterized protein DI09_167p60 [Mitosporidium daphniae]KGG52502.1 hypothetical protein DI09_167p60 [Mitosporidium daphniae]|eukprot:XP_013238938.1 uncharacterized protein DI09_167p60 [Mitosporidium daphniae]
MDPTLRNGIFSTILTLFLLLGVALFILKFYPPEESSFDPFKIYNKTIASNLHGDIAPNQAVWKNDSNIKLNIITNETDIITIKDPIPHFIEPSSFLYILFSSYESPIRLILSLSIGGAIGFIISQLLQSKSKMFVSVSNQNHEPKLNFKQIAIRIALPMLLHMYLLHTTLAAVYGFIWKQEPGDTWDKLLKAVGATGNPNYC